MVSLKEEYKKMMADKICLSVNELNYNESILIDHSFVIFAEKLEEIKLLSEELYRKNIELLNIKAMRD